MAAGSTIIVGGCQVQDASLLDKDRIGHGENRRSDALGDNPRKVPAFFYPQRRPGAERRLPIDLEGVEDRPPVDDFDSRHALQSR